MNDVDVQSKTFLTDSNLGQDTAFLDADTVQFACLCEGGVLLYLEGREDPVVFACRKLQAQRTLHLLADSTNALQIDRKALMAGDDVRLESRADLVRAKVRNGTATGSKIQIASQKLLQICEYGYKIKAIKACRDVFGRKTMGLKDAKTIVEDLVEYGKADFGDYADNIDLSVFDEYL